MISIGIAICLASLVASLYLLVNFYKERGTLYRRISALAPGAVAVKTERATRRIRSLDKSTALVVDSELVDLTEMLATMLLAGQSLFQAIARITQISRSQLATEFSILLKRVELGGDLSGELGALCQRIPTDSVREFSNKLSLALARGTPLANSLLSLANSLRASNSAAQLRKAGVNETKMLIPVVLLICPVTIIFALYPSSQYLMLGF
jgi:tight adherence protein C